MVNTVTQRTLIGSGSDRNILRSIHISSDGTEEADLVVYDNSTFIADTSKGALLEMWVSGSDCIVRLEWDQSTDSPAFVANPSTGTYWDFRSFGGVTNPNGTGATGDLVLTTSNLDAGDELMVIIRVAQN